MSVGALKLLVPPPFGGYETFGLFKIVTGRLTVHTQTIWNTQNPKNLKKWSRLSSNRSSFPVFNIRKSRNPERRMPQTITKRDATILRAWTFPDIPIDSVMTASTTKFVPPAKSVLTNQKRELRREQFIKVERPCYGKKDKLVANWELALKEQWMYLWSERWLRGKNRREHWARPCCQLRETLANEQKFRDRLSSFAPFCTCGFYESGCRFIPLPERCFLVCVPGAKIECVIHFLSSSTTAKRVHATVAAATPEPPRKTVKIKSLLSEKRRSTPHESSGRRRCWWTGETVQGTLQQRTIKSDTKGRVAMETAESGWIRNWWWRGTCHLTLILIWLTK